MAEALNEAGNLQQLRSILQVYDPYTWLGKKERSRRGDKSYKDIVRKVTGDITGRVGSGTLEHRVKGDPVKIAQAAFQEATERLKQIDPYFDPKNYMMDMTSHIASRIGGGSSANKQFALASPYAKAFDILKAVEKAEEAAKHYEKTGKVKSAKEMYSKEWQSLARGGNYSYTGGGDSRSDPKYTVSQSFEDFSAGQGIPESAKQAANAAAARAGTDLPFGGEGIGEMAAGGRFTTAEEAQQFYDEGGKFKQSDYDARGPVGEQGQIAAPTQTIQEYLDQGYTPFAAKNKMLQAYERRGMTPPAELTNWDPNAQPSPPPGIASLTGGGPGGPGGEAGPGGAPGAPGAGPGGSVQDQAGQQGYNEQAALDLINNSELDAGTKSLFREVLRNWDPDSELNLKNVMKTFQNIKETTISPYFKEQSKLFEDELQRNKEMTMGERGRELEGETMQGEQQMRGARAGLEGSGLTFSGEAGRLLGQESAFGAPGTEGGIPTKKFGEGLVQQQQRLMTTSSSARHKKRLEDMARQAERTLGTQQAQGLVGGVQQLGGITGTMQREQRQAEAQTLTGLYQQEQQNLAASKPMKVFS